MRKTHTISIVFYCILAVLIISNMTSCKKNNINDSGGAPLITRVRTVFKNDTNFNVVHPINLDSNSVYSQPSVAAFDSTTTDGKIGTLYAIIGQNLNTTTAVYLNGVAVYFNPAYLSNTTIQITIPNNVPYSNSTTSNLLTVVNPHGKADFKFIIEQPMPGITAVDQLAGNPGDIITITGTTFNGLSGVSFGKTPATVISNTINTTTQVSILKVQVPVGVTAGAILVTTAATKGGGTGSGPLLGSGTSKLSNGVSAVHFANGIFGFNTAVFEDQYENGWSANEWNNTPGVASPDNTTTKRGTASLKVAYTGGYDGLIFSTGTNLPVSPTAAIKFSLFGGKGTGGKLVQITLNGTDNQHAVQISLVENTWTDYIIPIGNFADASKAVPTSLSSIIMQEFSGNASVFNIDDMGIVDLKK